MNTGINVKLSITKDFIEKWLHFLHIEICSSMFWKKSFVLIWTTFVDYCGRKPHILYTFCPIFSTIILIQSLMEYIVATFPTTVLKIWYSPRKHVLYISLNQNHYVKQYNISIPTFLLVFCIKVSLPNVDISCIANFIPSNINTETRGTGRYEHYDRIFHRKPTNFNNFAKKKLVRVTLAK